MSNNLEQIFKSIYHNNDWQSQESVSGHGSTLADTAAIREAIPLLLDELHARSILDIPVGDYHWFSQMSLPRGVHYIGADIVPELILTNIMGYPDVDFRVLDLVSDPLPKVDVVLVRDCFGHLSNRNIWKALHNIQDSGSTYLLATTFPDMKWSITADTPDGGWRPVNLAVQFKLGPPLALINEDCQAGEGAYHDKSLALWRLNE